MVSAQVWPMLPPAAICLNVWPPVTTTGPDRSVVVPSPSCPRLFLPQQYALPSLVSAHVCCTPASMRTNLSPVATETGASRFVDELSPSCPFTLLPQQ